MIDNKIFYNAGDLVTLKQDIPNKPTMLVKSVDKAKIPDKSLLLGVVCFWFTTDGCYQEKSFNTKDLVKVVC